MIPLDVDVGSRAGIDVPSVEIDCWVTRVLPNEVPGSKDAGRHVLRNASESLGL
jgi:hypothetical protein